MTWSAAITLSGSTGPTGPVGLNGVTGASGLVGLDGVTGATGLLGLTGPSGATGLTGPSGATGLRGLDGVTGATGLDGVTGATGLTGPSGATGLDGVTGVTGLVGPSGATGLTGPSGATGLTGLDGVTGATGLTGPSGATGLTGPSGATGLHGATGLDGVTGATGLHGVTGATGLDGVTGPTGLHGVTGATGLTGPSGATGLEGVTGATGPTGVTGPIGVTGVTGPVGVTGVTGLIGPSGPSGLRGSTGVTGSVGATGSTGPLGIDGVTGPTGVTGPFAPALMQFIPSAGTPSILSATSFTLYRQNIDTFVSDCVTTPRINYQANGIFLSCALPAIANEDILNIGISGEGIGWTAVIGATNNGTNNSLGLYDSNSTQFGSSINYTAGDIITMYADGIILTLTVYSTYAGQGTTVITMPLTTSIATHMRFFAQNSTGNPYTITNAFYMPTGLTGLGATGASGYDGATGLTGPTGPSAVQGSMPSRGYYYAATTSAMTDGVYTVQPDTEDTAKQIGNFSATYTTGTGVLSNPTDRTLQILVSYDIKVSAATTWTSANIVDTGNSAVLDSFLPNSGSLTVERSVVIPLLASQAIRLDINQTQGSNANTLVGTYTRILFTQLDQVAGVDGANGVTGATGPGAVQAAMPTLAYYVSAALTYDDDTATTVLFDTQDATKTKGTLSATYTPGTGILNNPTANALTILINYDLQVTASTTWTSSNIVDSDTPGTILDTYVPAAGSLRVERSIVVLLQPSQNIILKINQTGGSGDYDLAATYSRILFTQLDYLLGPDGPTGPLGPTGIRGVTGPQGLRGFTGVTGPAGGTLLTENFIVAGQASDTNDFMYSYNGVSWLGITKTLFTGTGAKPKCVAWNGALWVAVGMGSGCRVAYSSDGITWTASTSGNTLFPDGSECNTIAWTGSLWIVGGSTTNLDVSIAYSYDGINWTNSASGTDLAYYCYSMASNSTLILAGCNTSQNPRSPGILYSYDGINWLATNFKGPFMTESTSSVNVSSIVWNGIIWVAGASGTEGRLTYSLNGIDWTDSNGTALFTTSVNSVSWNGSLWLAGGNGTNKLAYSYDGITWTASTSGNNQFSEYVSSIVWNGSVWIVSGINSGANKNVYSSNAITWTTIINSDLVITQSSSRRVLPYVGYATQGGPTGSTGPTGPVGLGIPTGGTAGQIISKVDTTDYNTQWSTDMAFIASYSVNWATTDPTTIGSAINRIAAAVSTLKSGPIP